MVATPGKYILSILSGSAPPTTASFSSPGRFLGVNNIKVMFIHILLNYDVQLEDGSLERPPNSYFAAATIPNQEVELMFRKRTGA